MGQRLHIKDLITDLGQQNVRCVGIDTRGYPVIERRDVRGLRTYSIHPDGRGVNPMSPILPPGEEDVHDQDCELMLPILAY
jgi:hypothetical protein